MNEYENENDSNMSDKREAERIKMKFGFKDIVYDDIDSAINTNCEESSDNKRSPNITFTNHDVKKITFSPRIKNIIVNNHQSYQNNNLINSSTKCSVNAVISMIHNNYNNIVENGEVSSRSSSSLSSFDSLVKMNRLRRESITDLLSEKPVYHFIKKDTTSTQIPSGSLKGNSSYSGHLSQNAVESLSDLAMYNLFNMVYEMYDTIINSGCILSSKINFSLNNLFSPIISSFKYMYHNSLELAEYYFKSSRFKKGNYIYPFFDLIIKSHIILKDVGKCYSLKFSYVTKDHKGRRKEYQSRIKFDLVEKGGISHWIVSEIEQYKNKQKRTCYGKQVLSFSPGDYIQFRINIFNVSDTLDPFSIKFYEMTSENIPAKCSESSLRKKQIDELRQSEIEIMINRWKTVSVLTSKSIIKNIMNVYINNFNIIEFWYDITKMYLFKVVMKASKEGIVSKNRYISFDIKVVGKNDNVLNEVCGLGLLNVQMGKTFSVRVGEILVLYIMDL